MGNMPRVSVVMPVYNGERFLSPAIESILNQTFKDFEFIIVDDGSTDASSAIIDKYAQADNRIRAIHQPNQGIVPALNRACHLSTSKYIARMDADDISLPERLEKQVKFLEAHPGVGIIGSWVRFINEENHVWHEVRFPTNPVLVEWTLPFYSPLAHPAVMMRRSAIAPLGFYKNWPVEDYELWCEACFTTQIANIPDVLFHYRRWEESLSSRTSERGEKRSDEIVQKLLSRRLGEPIDIQIAHYIRLFTMEPLPSAEAVQKTASVIRQIRKIFLSNAAYPDSDQQLISRDVSNKYYILAVQARRFSPLNALSLAIDGFRTSPPSVEQLQKAIRRLQHLRGVGHS
jgi:glycosyltransferase involved in cell wall biosynthesis